MTSLYRFMANRCPAILNCRLPCTFFKSETGAALIQKLETYHQGSFGFSTATTQMPDPTACIFCSSDNQVLVMNEQRGRRNTRFDLRPARKCGRYSNCKRYKVDDYNSKICEYQDRQEFCKALDWDRIWSSRRNKMAKYCKSETTHAIFFKTELFEQYKAINNYAKRDYGL